jgi:hypothetical protein
MKGPDDTTRVHREHALDEKQRRSLDEERDTQQVDRKVDQPMKPSRRETRSPEADRGAATPHPEQYEEFMGSEQEPSERTDSQETLPGSAG